MERRSFLKLFALPAIPTGFVVSALAAPVPMTFSEIVQQVLRKNREKMARNIAMHNRLFDYVQSITKPAIDEV